MPLVVGVDLGTQSCKVVLCDERLAVLAEHQVPIATYHPQPGWAEQDVQSWFAAMMTAIGSVLAARGASAGDIAAIGIAGQLDGCVGVDDHGTPVGRALIWQDRRAIAETRTIDAARVHAITGQVADPSH